MKLSTPLLLLAGASTCVSAQWTDYLNKILNTGGEKQVPLKNMEPEDHVEDREVLIARRVRSVTSENWLSLVQPSSAITEQEQKESAAAAEAVATTATPTEWYYYFTSSVVNGTKNVTYWDGVFNDTVYTFAKDLDVNFGKVDCATEASKDLCRDFYITSQIKIPQFYHLVAYPDRSVEIRELPWNITTIGVKDQVNHYTQFHYNEEWKKVDAWTGVFNPVNGTFKDVRPYAGIALTYYESMPQWVPMLLISVVGRTIMTRVSRRTTEPTRAGTQPIPQATS
ncbi:unnamed protein product [Tuber melanosporum]|jgi:hypothetical protein|uniref:(Perigord truffle) hypothetical protein n=1 Tax=Tuber melanosporum (strain Mel28) TaxID=656061 RepID=D5GHZ5_TUBMM|nr:uncharacterized protein GSTUM_00008202001 [Tuber melanosporum]CAZ84138.1 unnamed protein product [Tuber melanosporum]